MKPIEDIVACVIDYGSFISLADCMARKCRKVYYHSPAEQEYLGIERSVIGDGFLTFERLDDPLQPKALKEIDLWIFPDIGYGGFQRHLRHDLGKLVFGSMGASDLELARTKFLDVLKEVGLPVVHTEEVIGLTRLASLLKKVERKHVKINYFRENMETWKHRDYFNSERELERLSTVFGPLKEFIRFVVQDEIVDEPGSPVVEIGYDGWMITSPDGEPQFPASSFQGYELKNELYLGSELPAEEQPESVRYVNEKFAPVLAKYGYRNFWATEIREKNGVPNFIDPTARMAGQTMEHLLETCTNLPEVILAGAQGVVIQPQFSAKFAAEATMHYKSANAGEAWKSFRVPEEIQRWVKMYHCCFADDAYQYPPYKLDELGVVVGNGDTVEAAIDNLKEHFDALKDEPVSIEMSGFADLIKEIKTAQKEGIKFSDSPLPKPTIALED